MVQFYNADGRKNIHELYKEFLGLQYRGWSVNNITKSKSLDGSLTLPISAFSNLRGGKAVYLISGIHGDEPSGPIAVSQSLNIINEISREFPFVLMPLCNPVGYTLNWRYPRQEKWQPNKENISVGDCEHLILRKYNPIRNLAACEESEKISEFILKNHTHIPAFSINLHEDIFTEGAYIYCHHGKGVSIAENMLETLKESGLKIVNYGKTRFNESINKGIVLSSEDGSIDEFLASDSIYYNGRIISKYNAENVFSIEIPANLPLEKRVFSNKKIIENLALFSKLAGV